MRQIIEGVAMRPLAAALACVLLTGPAVAADSDRIQELEQKLARSMEMLEKLSSRLNEIETSKASGATDTKTAARIEQLEQSLVAVSESTAKKNDIGLPLHGFLDVGYGRTSRADVQNANANRRSGFGLGNLDLYLTPQLSDRVRALAEVVFEYGQDGALTTDIERLQIAYQFNDAVTLWAGRFHTPYGYWNTAFHHGAQLQTSILRPRMVAFEDQGGIMQAHTTGALMSGAVRAGAGKFGYDVWLGNGAVTVSDRNGAGGQDFNRQKNSGGNNVGANLRYAFGGGLSGLTLGVHGFSSKVSNYNSTLGAAGSPTIQPANVDSTTQLRMLGGYGVLERDDWEVIGEYYSFNNENTYVTATSPGPIGKFKSRAGFIQVGKTLADVWTPYVRLEKAVLNQNDNYFASLNDNNSYQSGRSYTRNAFGLRYNIDPRSAVKFEYHNTNELRPAANGGDYKYNEARVQYAIRF